MDKKKVKQSLQEKVYVLLDWDERTNRANLRIKMFLAVFTLLAVAVVIVDSFSNMPFWWRIISLILNFLITALFSFEYLLRLWVAPLQFPKQSAIRARLHYMRMPSAIVDLLAILPFYLMVLSDLDITSLRTLWILRLFILLKFNRFFHTLDIILSVLKRKRRELGTSLLATGSLMLISSAVIYMLEGQAQPDKFSNILSGLWWAVSTLLTIGYGDIYPVTAAGKVLASIVAVLGVGLIAVPTGILGAGYMEEMQSRRKAFAEQYAIMLDKKNPQASLQKNKSPDKGMPSVRAGKSRQARLRSKRTPENRHYQRK